MQINLSNEEIANFIKMWEGPSFECKETLNREIKEKLSTYFAAFANTMGGLIILGVNNSRETIGYSLKKGEREYISEQAKSCRPQVQIGIEEERDYDNQKIVLIKVSKSDNKIHIDNKYRFPIRVGSNLDYLDITGLIPLAKEKLGLDYKTTNPELTWEISPSRDGVKTKATRKEIELCLNGIEGLDKEVRLQGLKELEILAYKRELADELRVFVALDKLLIDTEAEIRKKVIYILELIFNDGNNDKSKQKLVDRYITNIIHIARTDSNLEVRSEAIRTLVKLDQESVIEIIIEITLHESDEVYSKIKSYSGLDNLGEGTKLKFKNRLMEELKSPEYAENIKERIKDVFGIIRISNVW